MISLKGWGGVTGIFVALLICGDALGQAETPTANTAPSTAALPLLGIPPKANAPENSEVLPAFPAASKTDDGCDDGWLSGLTLDGEYLFLRPSGAPFMNYAIVNSSGGNVPDGQVVSRDWGWRSAFRTGLRYRLRNSPWGVGFFYTYLHSNDSGAVGVPNDGTLFATNTHPGTVEQVQSAAAQTGFNYNVFDLEVGRWWHPDPSLALRTFGGGRFARIDQNFTSLYDGGDANMDQVTRRLHFNGGGFRIGGEASWLIGGGFSLFGRGNASLLGGDFHSTLVETNNAGATTLTNVSDHFSKVVPVTELTMGLGWQYRALRLTAGYTFINWFDLVNMPTFTDDAHQGKLIYQTGGLNLQGLVLRAEWWF